MRFNIAVCDDNIEYGEIVTEIIKTVALNINMNCKISTYSSGRNLVQAFKKNLFDIIFLDMEMPELNGIETGLLIREISKDPVIFYLTSYKEYAYESYKVKAKNYLLKPVSTSIIEDALRECNEEIRKEVMFLDVKDFKGVKYRIPVNEITYILRKKEDRKVHIHRLYEEEVIIVQTLESIEKELEYNDYIVRASKSCLINMRNVRTIKKNIVYFSNEAREEASRRCLAELNNKFKLKRLAVKL